MDLNGSVQSFMFKLLLFSELVICSLPLNMYDMLWISDTEVPIVLNFNLIIKKIIQIFNTFSWLSHMSVQLADTSVITRTTP